MKSNIAAFKSYVKENALVWVYFSLNCTDGVLRQNVLLLYVLVFLSSHMQLWKESVIAFLHIKRTKGLNSR